MEHISKEALASPVSRSPLTGSHILAQAVERFGTTLHLERDQVVSAPRDPDDVPAVYFLTSGLAVSKKTLRDGRQQTVALWVPGDIIDHEAVTIGEVFSTTYALGTAQVTQVSVQDFAALTASDPIYGRLFMRFVAYQGVLAREWLLRLGRLNAREKTAHLLCELFWRLDPAGHTSDDYCELALRQSELADMLALSLVQQNRSLASLRTQGLLDWSNKGFRIIERQRLARLANFDEAYLRASIPQHP